MMIDRIVVISVRRVDGSAGLATGFYVDAKGAVATADHVILDHDLLSMSSDYVRLRGQGKCPSSPLSYDRTVIRGTCPWCASWAGSWLRRTCGPCSCGCPTPWRLPEWRGPEA